jgi:hypothetical protein
MMHDASERAEKAAVRALLRKARLAASRPRLTRFPSWPVMGQGPCGKTHQRPSAAPLLPRR